MNKELIDRAWACLPREFKEEVKKLYVDALDASNSPHDPDDRKWGNYRVTLLEKLFSIHNLTSDAEEEEMLHIRRSEVTSRYEAYSKESANVKNNEPYLQFCEGKLNALTNLFGSKCLPDKPNLSEIITGSEPKFKVGDRVRIKGDGYEPNLHKGDIGEILDTNDKEQCFVLFKKSHAWIYADCLEPYTEPKDEHNSDNTVQKYADVNSKQNQDHFREAAKMKPIESKVSVYLATQEEDEEFRMLLHQNGFTWNTNASLISLTYWTPVFEDDKVHYVHPDKTVTYCGEKTSDTLTFSEFKKQYFGENVNLSQETANCDKEFDTILKDGFRNHNRLQIAAMAMQGLLANSHQELVDMKIDQVAKLAVEMTDALIAECENTNNNKQE